VESSETQEYLEEIDTNGHVIRHNIEEVATLGKESHSRLHAHVHDNTGLLSNGIMDLVVIDSPGLNTDSAKTTAIFAKQKHIDAIIFVVNSENHFTQSVNETRVLTEVGLLIRLLGHRILVRSSHGEAASVFSGQQIRPDQGQGEMQKADIKPTEVDFPRNTQEP